MLHEKQFIESIMTAVSKKFSLQDWSYEVDIFEETNENCFSVILPVKLQGFDNSENITKYLIVKVAPQNNFQEATNSVYAIEIGVYEKLIPAIKCFKTKTHINDLFPQCFYTTIENRVIVLNDMRYDGYKISKENLSLDHIRVALKALAEFHGLSMLVFQRSKIECGDLFKPWDENASFSQVLKLYLNEHLHLFEDTKVYQTIKTFQENLEIIVLDSVQKVKGLVYGHGDFWRENILFKYEGQNPIKACILDFQHTRLICPAQDVLFFIVTSASSDLRRKFFMEFISTYYEALQETLAMNEVYGVEVKFYTEEDFKNDIEEVAQYVLIHAIFALSWWSGVEDSQKKDILTEDKIKSTTIEQQIINTENFKMAVIDIIQDLKDFGYLNTVL